MKKFPIPIQNNPYDVIAYLLIFSAFLYVITRAWILPLYFDEALTFLNHATGPFSDIILFKGHIPSNNHLLNSLLIKIFTSVFGDSEFVIRLPAIIGFILYLIGVFRILRLFLDKPAEAKHEKYLAKAGNLEKYHEHARGAPFLTGLCLMIFNPFLLEIFSGARGYALGLGFLMMGVYYYLLTIRDSKLNLVKHLSLCITMLTLSVLSHLVFLNVYLAVSILIIGHFFIYSNFPSAKELFKKFFKTILLPILLSITLLFTTYFSPTLRMYKEHEFSEGGISGFWQDTVYSLMSVSLYGQPYDISFFYKSILGIIGLAMGSALFFITYLYLKKQKLQFKDQYLISMWLLLMLMYFIIVSQWIFLNIKFVMDRRAVFFIPIFILFLLLLWERIVETFSQSPRIRFIKFVFYFLALMTFGHFLQCANFRYYFFSPAESEIKSIMQSLNQKNKNLLPETVSIGAHEIFIPSIAYYKLRYNMDWLQWPFQFGARDSYDYYLLTKNTNMLNKFHYPDFVTLQRRYNFQVVRHFPLSQTILAISALPVNRKD